MFKVILKIVAVSSTVLSAVSYAATNGTLGPTSTFSYNVTITIPERVRVSNIQNLAFGLYPGSGNVTQSQGMCIYSNTSGGGYDVTLLGDGAGNAFTISQGPNTIPYRVFWNDVAGSVGEVEATSGITLSGQTGAHRTSLSCGGSDNANISILMEEGNVQGQPNGSYTGVLSIIIEPN